MMGYNSREQLTRLQYLTEKRLQPILERFPLLDVILREIAKITKLHRVWIVWIFVMVAVLVLCWGLGAGPFLVSMAVTPYPIRASLRKRGIEDVAFWLQYWLIFGLIFTLENFINGSNFWFYLPKLLLLVWCLHPKYRGATTIYETGRAILSSYGPRRFISKLSEMHTPPAAETTSPSNTMDLKVTVVGASGLPAMDKGMTDSYCLLKIVSPGSETNSTLKRRTTTKPATLSPSWHETLNFKTEVTSSTELQISVWHKTGLGRDQIIGSVGIPLGGLDRNEEQDGLYDLISHTGAVVGDIRLVLLLL